MREKEDKAYMQKVLKIIEEHLHQSGFDAAALAKAMGENKKQLNRKIHKLSGLNTTQFIRSSRLKHAARLLQQRAGSITQIAYDSGFNNLSYFARCFRRQYGKSPLEFLNEVGNR